MLSVFRERHAHQLQEIQRLVVRPRAGYNRDVHSLLPLDLVQLDFRENRLVADSQRVIAPPVK
jgi:hypothetical protein